MAVAWALIVIERLPISVRVGLAGTGEPLDRLLTNHGAAWTAELAERVVTGSAREASSHFAWAVPGTPLVEVTRILSLAGEPIAVLIDEAPLLPEVGTHRPLTRLDD